MRVRTLLLGAFVAPFALIAGAALAETPVSAESSEAIGKAAADGKKRFRGKVDAGCSPNECIAKFGAKNKSRTVEALTCFAGSGTGNLLAAVSIDKSPLAYEFIMAPRSNVSGGGTSYSVYEWTQPFEIPKGLPLNIRMTSLGLSVAAFCTIKGTIE